MAKNIFSVTQTPRPLEYFTLGVTNFFDNVRREKLEIMREIKIKQWQIQEKRIKNKKEQETVCEQ